jgi:hypothetical protein
MRGLAVQQYFQEHRAPHRLMSGYKIRLWVLQSLEGSVLTFLLVGFESLKSI